jgi:transposase
LPTPKERHLPANVEDCHELIGDLLQEINKMQTRIDWLARKLFGRSSERLAAKEIEFFGESIDPANTTGLCDPSADQPPAPQDSTPESQAPDQTNQDKSKRGGRHKLPADLPRQRLIHDVPEEAKVCGECGCEKKRIGEEVTEQLEYTPASLFAIEHVCPKYACPRCHNGVIQGEKPAQPIEKALAGPGLLAHVIVSKYGDHSPLYRQESILARHGVDLSRATLCQWAMGSAEVLEPVVTAMKSEIFKSHSIHTDDTPVDVHTGQGHHQARLWVYAGDREHPYTVYDFTWTRAGEEGPKKFLEGFRGILQADAYGGYDALFKKDDRYPEKIPLTEAGCNAHGRRYFFEAKEEDPVLAHRILSYYKKLYEIERGAKEHWPALCQPRPGPTELAEAAAGRQALREEKSKPLMEELKNLLDELQRQGLPLPKSGLGKAIGYTLNNWAALSLYLADPLVEIDNNAAERALRPLCLGRKNWLHLGSRRGGRAAAVLFSLVQSARRHLIDPFVYLRDLLTRIPTHPQSRIQDLFPDNWKILAEQSAAEAMAATNPDLPALAVPSEESDQS